MAVIHQNAFYVPENGRYFCSWSSHDFVGCMLPDCKEYYVDGGLSYFRTVGNFELLEQGRVVDYRLTDENTFEEHCDKLLMFDGTRHRPLKEFDKEQLTDVLSLTKIKSYLPIVRQVASFWLSQK